jgi:hypothetical protein
MEAGSIVEALDEGEDIALGLGTGLVLVMMDEFGLQGVEEAHPLPFGSRESQPDHHANHFMGPDSNIVTFFKSPGFSTRPACPLGLKLQ